MENDFCDVAFSCEEKQIKAHKLIICSCSPVLRNILKLNLAPHPVIYLRRVINRNIQNLLNFMYVAEEDLPSFHEIAEDLNVRDLCERNKKEFESDVRNNTHVVNLNFVLALKRKYQKVKL